MIRVLHIVQSMDMGGIETFIMNIYRSINRDKIQFDFFMFEEKESYYEEEIKKLGGTIYKEKLTKNPIYDIIRIKNKIKEIGNVNVVHEHLLFFNGIVSIAAKLANVKTIISHSHTSEDSRKNTILRKIYRGLNRFLIKIFSTDYLACSKEAGQFLYGDKLLTNKKIKIINNGINMKIYENLNREKLTNNFYEKYHLDKNTILLGNVGKLRKVKNQWFIIKIVKYLKEKNKKVICFFVGDGELEKDLKKEIENYGLTENFVFTGVVNNVHEYMKIFDVFLFPSLFEGFGIALLEAQAAGTKCIASTNVPKAADLNINLVDYIEIEDKDEEKWADRIINIVNQNENKVNKELINETMKSKGFDINYNVQQLIEIYTK